MAQVKVLLVAVAVVFFGLMLPFCSALECYECDMCQEHEEGSIKDCSIGQDVCMKIALGGASMKKCAFRALCMDGDVELDFADSARNTLHDFIGAVIGAEKEKPLRQVVHCCTGNKCNAGSALIPATSLLLMVLLVVGPLLQ